MPFSIRQRVIQGYGGVCTFCGKTTGGLEIDHIHNNGHEDRRQRTGKKLEESLWQAFKANGVWPLGLQLLCKRCHNIKSGRIPRMGVAKGKTQLNVHLSDLVAHQLSVLAESPTYHGSKSEVVQEALEMLLQGTTHETVIAGLHQRLSVVNDSTQASLRQLAQSLSAISISVNNLAQAVKDFNHRFERLEATLTHQHEHMQRAYDSLKAHEKGRTLSGWLKG